MSAFRLASEWARGVRLRTKAVVSTESTNDDAKKAEDPLMVLGGPGDAILYLTDHQTRGRGRGDNLWISSPGQALLSSWVFAVDAAQPIQPIFTPLAGLALHDAVHAAWPALQLSIKPPNDLYTVDPVSMKPHKLGGLLVEVVTNASHQFHTLIVGLGLNVSGSPEANSSFLSTSIAGALTSAGHPFVESHLFLFLNMFRQNLERAIALSAKGDLHRESCAKLTAAISKHPLFVDLKEVSPQGDLIKASGVIKWTDL